MNDKNLSNRKAAADDQRLARSRLAKLRVLCGTGAGIFGAVFGETIKPYDDTIGNLVGAAGIATLILMLGTFLYDLNKLAHREN